MTLIELIGSMLDFEEGYRARPYYCSEGYPTVAIGWRIGPRHAPLKNYDMYVTREVAKVLLLDRVEHLMSRLNQHEWFVNQNDSRKAVLISMAYQMGFRKLMGFTNMIEALAKNDYVEAKLEAIDSRWYKQTTARAERHAKILSCGSAEEVYGEILEKHRL